MNGAAHRGRILALGAGVLAVAGCGLGYLAPPVTPELASHSRAGTSTLQRGYQVHQATCAKCHPFEDPRHYDEDELREDVMPVMGRKSKLSPADQNAVLEYLLAARRLRKAIREKGSIQYLGSEYSFHPFFVTATFPCEPGTGSAGPGDSCWRSRGVPGRWTSGSITVCRPTSGHRRPSATAGRPGSWPGAPATPRRNISGW